MKDFPEQYQTKEIEYSDSTVVSKLRVEGVIVKLADLPTVMLVD